MTRSLYARLAAFSFVAAFGLLPTLTACVSDEPAAQPDLCIEYCEVVTANCTGELKAFESVAQCEKTCALLPQGTEGDSVNSVGCRLAHARIGNSKEECRMASAFGGGACGGRCDVFCDLVDKNCIQPLAGAGTYPSKSTCFEACSGIRYDETVSEGTQQPFAGEDNLNCRMFHFILSLDDQPGHCPHTGVPSATCQ
jgi:hypothetical protein